MGVDIVEGEEQIFIPKSKNLQAVDVKTLVYPGFPTDLQQPFSVLLTQAIGSSIITDTVYSARFKHIDELRRMNANGTVEGRSAIIIWTDTTYKQQLFVHRIFVQVLHSYLLVLLLMGKQKYKKSIILNVAIVR